MSTEGAVSIEDGPIVVIGMGQLGRTFGQGLLVAGHTVVPVLRGGVVPDEASLVLITVGENDLPSAIESVPLALRERIALVQNELAPEAWQRHGLTRPTVASVFFEAKPGRPPRAILPTRIAGPGAGALVRALRSIGLDAEVLDERALPRALLEKNVYILSTNLAGLGTTRTVRELKDDPAFPRVFREVLEVERARFRLEAGLDVASLPDEAIVAATWAAFDADPEHIASGRSARERLRRTLARADQLALAVPTLRALG